MRRYRLLMLATFLLLLVAAVALIFGAVVLTNQVKALHEQQVTNCRARHLMIGVMIADKNRDRARVKSSSFPGLTPTQQAAYDASHAARVIADGLTIAALKRVDCRGVAPLATKGTP